MLVLDHADAGGRPAKMPRLNEGKESTPKPLGEDLVADLCKIIEQQSKEIATLRELSAGLRGTEAHVKATMQLNQEDKQRAKEAIAAVRADEAANAKQPVQAHVQAQPAVQAKPLFAVAAASPIAATLTPPPPLLTVTSSPRDYSDGCETPPTEDESAERERLALKRPRPQEFFSGLDALTAAADTACELPAPAAVDATPLPKPTDAEAPPRRCRDCGTTNTPKWRCGMTLCNACGLRNVKRNGGPRATAAPTVNRTDALVADYRFASEKLAVVTPKPVPNAMSKPMAPHDDSMAPQHAPFQSQQHLSTSMPPPNPMHAVALPGESNADARFNRAVNASGAPMPASMNGLQPRFGAVQHLVSTMRYAAPTQPAGANAPQQAHAASHPPANALMHEQPTSRNGAIRPTATYAAGFRPLGNARAPPAQAQHKQQPQMLQQQPQMATMQQMASSLPQQQMASSSPLLRSLSHAGARAAPFLHPQRPGPMRQLLQGDPSVRGPPALVDAGGRGVSSRNGRAPPFATLATELRAAHAQHVQHQGGQQRGQQQPLQHQHVSHHHSGAPHVHEQLPHGRTSLFHALPDASQSMAQSMALGTACRAKLLAAPPAQMRASGLAEHLALARPFAIGTTLPSRYVQY
mmetsp:Transcript_29178/g.56357  ORF Transcript_29178/g.56357 Transcript_29178/m.56357 type:complete len:636 (-) Transcript_29178:1292-3199(-)